MATPGLKIIPLAVGLTLIAALLVGCPKASPPKRKPPPTIEEQFSASARDLHALLAKVHKLPEHLQVENAEVRRGDFDPNACFNVLTHIKMRDGCVLSYVYDFRGKGGCPVLYVRQAEEPPLATWSAFEARWLAGSRKGLDIDALPEYIDVADTPLGYGQLAILVELVNQFYLYWHFSFAKEIVTGKADLDRLIVEQWTYQQKRLPDAERAKLDALDLRPVMRLEEGVAHVDYVLFREGNGFVKVSLSFSRRAPHVIMDRQETVIVPHAAAMR